MQHIQKLHLEKNRINLLIFGCGPGTEILGFAKGIEKSQHLEGIIDLRISLLDRTNEWEFCCREVIRQIGSVLNYKLKFSEVLFYALDIEDFDRIREYSKLLFSNVDIYIMSYFFSEIYNDNHKREGFQYLIKEIAKNGKKGSKILFIDRRQEGIKDKLILILRNSGVFASSDLATGDRYNACTHFQNRNDSNEKFEMDDNIEKYCMLDSQLNCLTSILKSRTDAKAFWLEGTI